MEVIIDFVILTLEVAGICATTYYYTEFLEELE